MHQLESDHIINRLGVRPVINAADSYTIIGGSRMHPKVIEAMRQAAEHFVDLDRWHDSVGERIAVLTHNEAAMVTCGAAAALTVSVAACITGPRRDKKQVFPELRGMKKEVIVHQCQRNDFDTAVSRLGARIIEIGSKDGTSERELEQAIGPDTACILYFDTTQYAQGALPLHSVIRIARRCGIPLIVDAAAQLPPVDNLWRYTQEGADIAIFSGGKTLQGPQSSGLIVGREDLVRACRIHSGPASDAVGRPMKVSKEQMAGLYAAIERYINLDHAAVRRRHERIVEIFCKELGALGYKSERVYPGPTGQDYAFAMFDMRGASLSATEIMEHMKKGDPAIWVGLAREKSNHFCLNPLHLHDDEISLILERFRQLGTITYH